MKKLLWLPILLLFGCAGLEHAETKMLASKKIYSQCLEMFPTKPEKCEGYLRDYVKNVRAFILEGEELEASQAVKGSGGKAESLSELNSARIEENIRKEQLKKIVKKD